MNNLINKIGLDKIAHFGIGGLICAIFSLVFIIQDIPDITYKSILLYPFIGYIITMFLSIIKEYCFDYPNSDWKDILAGMLGCIFVHIFICFGVLCSYGTYCLNN